MPVITIASERCDVTYMAWKISSLLSLWLANHPSASFGAMREPPEFFRGSKIEHVSVGVSMNDATECVHFLASVKHSRGTDTIEKIISFYFVASSPGIIPLVRTLVDSLRMFCAPR